MQATWRLKFERTKSTGGGQFALVFPHYDYEFWGLVPLSRVIYVAPAHGHTVHALPFELSEIIAATVFPARHIHIRADNGSVHGSWVKWVNRSVWVT